MHRPDGAAVTGVRYTDPAGRTETVGSELVIDASGRGMPTLDLLGALGRVPPDETTIGVDLAYASAVFAIPDDAPVDWKGVFCFPGAGRASRGSLMLPLEGHRWIVTVGGRHGDIPPGDEAGFMEYSKGLRTPTIYNARRATAPRSLPRRDRPQRAVPAAWSSAAHRRHATDR